MNLYELTEQYKCLMSMIEEGEIPEEAISDTLEAISGELDFKIESIAKIIKTYEGQAKAIKTEEERLNAMRKSLENKAQSLKKYIEDSLIAINQKSLKTSLFSFNIQKNPPSVLVLDAGVIPEQYKIAVEPTIDKKAILQDLKNGVNVDGVEIKQTEGLRIR